MGDQNIAGQSSPPLPSGSPSRLPPLSSLSTYVHRPSAIAKCFLSDVYAMRPLLQAGSEGMRYAGRDVFMLGTTPCKMVELVAWVSGITQRESSMVAYRASHRSRMLMKVDDGDGISILPVTIKLALVPAHLSFKAMGKRPAHSSLPEGPEHEGEGKPAYFLSAKERQEQKRKLASGVLEVAEAKRRPPIKVYERKDIRVGDIVRVRGRVDEWLRRKASGEGEWVREVVVDQGSGGSIVAVHPEEQFEHAQQVIRLHQSTYIQPFIMPQVITRDPTTSTITPTASPSRANRTTSTIKDSMDVSSEMPSELSGVGDLCHTDRTFRQYLLDHLSQSVSGVLASAEAAGPSSVRKLLEETFPEYRGGIHKGKRRAYDRILRPTSPNSQCGDLTPTQGRFLKSAFAKHPSPFSLAATATATATAWDLTLQAWTITSILEVPHLEELARLVVDSEARKEERRRRRRIRDGQARGKDLEVERTRLQAGRKADEWRLSARERERRMEKLVGWCLRGIAEDGGLVQVRLPHAADTDVFGDRSRSSSTISTQSSGMWDNSYTRKSEEWGYVPLTPPLVLPLLLPHLEAEEERMSKIFLPKSDPRRVNGMTVEEVTGKLRGWGEEGRWERAGEWVVEEAIELGVRRGMLRREGKGWWVAQEA